jgi:hypothetical protein
MCKEHRRKLNVLMILHGELPDPAIVLYMFMLSFIFRCLYFFDLHILITPLVSSNSSYRNDKVLVLLYIYYEKED